MTALVIGMTRCQAWATDRRLRQGSRRRSECDASDRRRRLSRSAINTVAKKKRSRRRARAHLQTFVADGVFGGCKVRRNMAGKQRELQRLIALFSAESTVVPRIGYKYARASPREDLRNRFCPATPRAVSGGETSPGLSRSAHAPGDWTRPTRRHRHRVTTPHRTSGRVVRTRSRQR